MALQVQVVSPERILWTGEAEMVIVVPAVAAYSLAYAAPPGSSAATGGTLTTFRKTVAAAEVPLLPSVTV